MLFLSKAQEISKLYGLLKRGIVEEEEYHGRVRAILSSPYRRYPAGVSYEEENRLLWNLALDGIISSDNYNDQINKVRRMASIPIEGPAYGPAPMLRRKKGYVAPIVWLVIGVLICHSFWFSPIGVLVIILSLIWLSCRVSYNKHTEVENAQKMMQYGVRY